MVGERGVGARVVASAVGALLIAAAVPAPAQAAQPSPVEVPAETAAMGAMSLIPWYTAPSLVALRREVDTLWPGRSRLSDGSIGDNRHGRTINSHNPVGAANGPRAGTRGAVHALDITSSGVDVSRLLSAVIGDSRVWYVIHDSTIWSRTTAWSARPYSGDPHTTHIHINLREDSQSAATDAENSTRSWFSGKTSAAPAFLATPNSGLSLTESQVRVLQGALISAGFAIPAGATGVYGPQTTSAVAAFQRAQGWRGSEADGIAGPETLRRLGVPAATATTATPASYQTPQASTQKRSTSTTSRASHPSGLSKKKTKKLQRKLLRNGFTIPSGPTGMYGPETTRAVKAFQRAQGWRGSQADGIAGAETLRRLGVKTKSSSSKSKARSAKPSSTTTPTTSSSGTRGRRTWDPDDAYLVYDLQGALITKGFSIPAGQTGYFGPRTQQAVKSFQRSLGWRGAQADGIPGSQTLARLGL